MKIILARLVVFSCIVTMLAGCAAPQGGVAAGNQDGDPCAMGQSALAGAMLGALIGAAAGGKGGAAKGAVVGGAIGVVACVAVNVNSRQTKSAAQSERDYRQTRGVLPTEPVVVAYNVGLSKATVQKGQPLKISSTVEIVNGTNQPVQSIREELQLFNPDGSPIKNASKPFVGNTAGRYENAFELKLPANASQGVYGMKTSLWVNEKFQAQRDLRVQLVWDGTNAILLAMN